MAPYSEKLQSLIDYLGKLDSAVLALSGGLDSVLVAKALSLSGTKALAVTGRSETTPLSDLQDAAMYADKFGLEHRVVATAEMRREGFVSNPSDRCYHCKDVLFGLLKKIAKAEGYEHVLDGANLDDMGDHRPGMKAASEHGVLSPLLECGMSKHDIREAARELGLGIWQKPASPCLSSRFAYGVRITTDGLLRVARAEDYIRELMGIDELRVRDMGSGASVEVPKAEVMNLMSRRAQVVERLKLLGYAKVQIDPHGFESGKMNRALK